MGAEVAGFSATVGLEDGPATDALALGHDVLEDADAEHVRDLLWVGCLLLVGRDVGCEFSSDERMSALFAFADIDKNGDFPWDLGRRSLRGGRESGGYGFASSHFSATNATFADGTDAGHGSFSALGFRFSQ